jgi:hypothetical protein
MMSHICVQHWYLFNKNVCSSVNSNRLHVSLVVHNDVRLVVQVAQVHGARVGRELCLFCVGRRHPDVAAFGGHVDGGAGKALVADHVAALCLDHDVALEVARAHNVTGIRRERELGRLDPRRSDVSAIRRQRTKVRLDKVLYFYRGVGRG